MQAPSISLDPSDPDSLAPDFSTRELIGFVRRNAEALSVMPDAELQAYICDCAERFCAAQKQYETTGCFTHAADRDRFWQAEAEALRVRGSRPAIVARMERERGLA